MPGTKQIRFSYNYLIFRKTFEKDKITSVIDSGTNAGAGISYINFELSPELEQEYKSLAIKTASSSCLFLLKLGRH